MSQMCCLSLSVEADSTCLFHAGKNGMINNSTSNDKFVDVASLLTDQRVGLELACVRDTASNSNVRYHAMDEQELTIRSQHLPSHQHHSHNSVKDGHNLGYRQWYHSIVTIRAIIYHSWDIVIFTRNRDFFRTPLHLTPPLMALTGWWWLFQELCQDL